MNDLPDHRPDENRPPGSLSQAQQASLSQLAENANEQLFKAGAEGAEQSFGLGCLVFALPLLALDLILFLFGVFNLILALIVLAMGALVVAGLVTLMAYNARARRIEDAYQRKVAPEIDRALQEQGLVRQQFDQVASENLPEGAPLLVYLAVPLASKNSLDMEKE